MKTPEEKRWERMQQLLLAESRGDAPVRLASQRTLFGIKSHVEQVIEHTVAEEAGKRATQTKDAGANGQASEQPADPSEETPEKLSGETR